MFVSQVTEHLSAVKITLFNRRNLLRQMEEEKKPTTTSQLVNRKDKLKGRKRVFM